jgi:hypothetical protein
MDDNEDVSVAAVVVDRETPAVEVFADDGLPSAMVGLSCMSSPSCRGQEECLTSTSSPPILSPRLRFTEPLDFSELDVEWVRTLSLFLCGTPVLDEEEEDNVEVEDEEVEVDSFQFEVACFGDSEADFFSALVLSRVGGDSGGNSFTDCS